MWLDNLMCNVPEVMMCYHLGGIVQQYELIKTADIPSVAGFQPEIVQVRQLRPFFGGVFFGCFFGPSRAGFPALQHPAHAVWRALRRTHAR